MAKAELRAKKSERGVYSQKTGWSVPGGGHILISLHALTKNTDQKYTRKTEQVPIPSYRRAQGDRIKQGRGQGKERSPMGYHTKKKCTQGGSETIWGGVAKTWGNRLDPSWAPAKKRKWDSRRGGELCVDCRGGEEKPSEIISRGTSSSESSVCLSISESQGGVGGGS